LRENVYQDEWGTTCEKNPASWPIDAPIDYPIKTRADLAQTKISSLHPLQRTARMDLRAVKEKYGRRFCIVGNIDSSRKLPFGTASPTNKPRVSGPAASPCWTVRATSIRRW
jgi:hypothetical protein